MPQQEKRFEVEIGFHVRARSEGSEVPYFDCPLQYHDMSYDGLVAVQAAMVQLLETLNGYGIDTAEAMGLGEKLKAIGVNKKK